MSRKPVEDFDYFKSFFAGHSQKTHQPQQPKPQEPDIFKKMYDLANEKQK